jgi:hypothetical protein
MPYHVGAKGSYGCSGYPALKNGTNEVMGCHETRAQAAAQIYAINRSEGKIGKSMVKEGDMVMAPNDDEVYIGRIVHVMTDGMLGMPGSEYALMASPEEPAVLIQLFEMEEGGLEETEYFVGKKASEVMAMPSLEANIGMDKAYQGCGCPTCKELNVTCEECPVCQANAMKSQDCCGNVEKQAPCWEGYVMRGMKPADDGSGRMVPNCVPVEKREFSTATRERMAESGTAMSDGSFPISNKSDLMNAIRSVGRAKNYEAAKQHIIRRARALNALDMLPEDWRNKATKGMGQWSGSIFDLNPFVK